jgi:hypothetical protein
VSGQLHTPAALSPGKGPWYPLDMKLGGPQSRSGRGAEENNWKPLLGLEPPIIQPVAQSYTAELCRLLLKMWMAIKETTGGGGVRNRVAETGHVLV